MVEKELGSGKQWKLVYDGKEFIFKNGALYRRAVRQGATKETRPELTNQENCFLRLMFEAGAVENGVSHDAVIKHLWGGANPGGNAVRKMMSSIKRKLFPKKTRYNAWFLKSHQGTCLFTVEVSNVAGATDAATAPPPSTAQETSAPPFDEWLSERKWPPSQRPRGKGWVGTVVGDSLIVRSSLGIRGFDEITMEPTDADPGQESLPADFIHAFKKRHQQLKTLSGRKASITQFIHPLSEDHARFRWKMVDYAYAKSFHEVVESDIQMWNLFGADAGGIEVRRVPGMLVTHNVMILNTPDGQRLLVLAHRKKGGRPGGYYNNRWSVSFEEQFCAIDSVRDGRWFSKDPDLQHTITRGSKEEFLGNQPNCSLAVSLHAVQIETLNFNMGILGAVALRGMDFDDLVDSWNDEGTVDRAEHDALLAIPFRADVLQACIESDSLPAEFSSRVRKNVGCNLSADDHRWHPTSKARLALALWLLEFGAMSS